VIDEAAREAGRVISPEHFGISIAYLGQESGEGEQLPRSARSRRASAPPIPIGLPALRATLASFIEVGFSKFVLRPLGGSHSWNAELAALADAVGALQS
jgi:hypothetical protein